MADGSASAHRGSRIDRQQMRRLEHATESPFSKWRPSPSAYDLAVRSIAQLEGELFGRGAWNANMVREELDAPARTYLLDVLGEAEQAVVRGYAGFWYDGEDAELMTIGVGKAYQRQGIAAALLQALVDLAFVCPLLFDERRQFVLATGDGLHLLQPLIGQQ